ncbi:MAG: branched-chain amino acid ABC transporter substrate-binding protein [Actinomycetota bacterium]
MKRSRWLSSAAVASALLLLTAACAGGDDGGGGGGDQAQDCTWVIGTMGALSGDFAAIGVPIFQGIEFAVNEANDRGDLACELELQEEDSQGDQTQAPPLARSLVENEDLVAVVGPYFSGETLAVGEIFDSAGVAFLCPSCTNETIDDQGWETFFRAVANDGVQAPAAADYIDQVLQPETVAVVHDNQDYSKGIADTVTQELGDTAEGPFIIDPAETDYSAVVSQVANTEPDVVYYGGYVPQAGPLVKQLQEANVDATFFSDDGTKDPAFGDLAGKQAAEGALVTCPCVDPLKTPAASAFVDGIKQEYGRNPGTFAADAYDASNLIFEALKEASAEDDPSDIREDVQAYLDDIDGYEGIARTYTFADNGEVEVDPLEDIWVYEWRNSAEDFVSLGPVADEL